MNSQHDHKKEPSIEQNTRYMAWDIKNINKSIERMADALDKLVTSVRMRKDNDSGELPF